MADSAQRPESNTTVSEQAAGDNTRDEANNFSEMDDLLSQQGTTDNSLASNVNSNEVSVNSDDEDENYVDITETHDEASPTYNTQPCSTSNVNDNDRPSSSQPTTSMTTRCNSRIRISRKLNKNK